MQASPTSRLLNRVALRLRAVHFGRQFLVALLVFAGVYAAAVVFSRATALLPDVFEPWTLALVPAAALLVALALQRRPRRDETARLVDARAQTKDLFLTHTLIESAPGDYRPLVVREAEARAPQIEPAAVVPFHPWPRASYGVAALAALAALLLLPQWDPFRAQERREQEARREEALQDTIRAVVLRKEILRERDATAELSEPVDQALEELTKALREMQPQNRLGNLQRLTEEQKQLGEMWRRASEHQLKNAGDRPMQQTFGQAKNEKAAEWKEELQAGKTDALSRELQEMRELAERIAEASDPAEKQAMKEQLAERLQNLSDFMKSDASSEPLEAALKRAMEQLQLSEVPELSPEALWGLMESLELTEMELDELAQSLRDLQSLEEALKTVQMAKKANELEPLDGEACEECEGLGDYAELYRQMIAKAGGEGGGMGGPGIGEGGVAPEDPDQESAFNEEHAPSQMQPGRILLEWKTKEVSDPGEARREYTQALQQVRQNVSEAILQEQVPPRHREAIQKYFDAMTPPPEVAPEAPPEAPAEAEGE